MANERLTENIVRDFLREQETATQIIEEQATRDLTIAQALKQASKQGPGVGKPEFIVTDETIWPDGVLLFECKADIACHESARHRAGKPSTASDIGTCAVDGVLHYAKHVGKHRNVIAVAVSGEKRTNLRVSTYRLMKGAADATPLLDLKGRPIERLRSVSDYIKCFRLDPLVAQRDLDRLMAYTRYVHNFLRDYGKLTEPEKPLVISAVLLALRHAPFRAGWNVTPDADLSTTLFEAVEKVVRKAISGTKRELMMSAYEFVRTHPELTKKTKIKIKGAPEVTVAPLKYLIADLEREVLPFASAYPHVDVIGQFFAEFLRYTGGDGKGLGIVLTPRHLTELFVQVAEITRRDTVLDSCAGTGGFLISAMIEMDRQIGDDEAAKQRVREDQLIGIEQRSDMFAMCVSNMVLRGDGRSNLHRGDCFDTKQQDQIAHPRTGMRQPNKGLLNPPYSQKGEDQHELDFVKALMDMLAPGGTGVVVVPISCALDKNPAKERLLKAHTLVAAMSLPEELFYPVGTITCALVLRAHTPHEEANAPTWFGYWRDDGLVKVKHRGRVDSNHRWEQIKARWVSDFKSRAEIPGSCIKRRVTASDEWCAEAYLETDYSTLSAAEFARAIRLYAMSRLASVQDDGARPIESNDWKWFELEQIFDIRKGKRLTKASQSEGTVPFIGAIDADNGLARFISHPPNHPGNTITVVYNGNGVAEAFYQPQPFWASDDVNVLYPKFDLNAHRAMFLVPLLRQEKYRFSYGRKWHAARMKKSKIRLPVTSAGKPDWTYMEAYIKRLPFAEQIK